jgi:hypothetical protein
MPPENFTKFTSVISKIYKNEKCCEKCVVQGHLNTAAVYN